MAFKKEFISDEICRVTFFISKEYTTHYTKVNLVGDFNSWSSSETPMIKQEDGSYSVTLDLPANREFQFRYLINGNSWENDWWADKYVPAPYSNVDNSVVITRNY